MKFYKITKLFSASIFALLVITGCKKMKPIPQYRMPFI